MKVTVRSLGSMAAILLVAGTSLSMFAQPAIAARSALVAPGGMNVAGPKVAVHHRDAAAPAPRTPNRVEITITVCASGCDFATIQGAVNAASSGDTISVQAGTYTENVTVPIPVTIDGAGQGQTIVQPAISNPNCGGGGGGSLCAGASNVFLVQASGVTISNLTVNGDNPSLSSGVVVGGADIDARNGIITDHTLGPTFNNLVVQHVTVQNIYLRGVYASTGGTFDFNHDTVDNVQGGPSSVAMFNFFGSGSYSHNVVSHANDAISSNWSAGVSFTNNTITTSGSGIHTDNSGETGSTDIISGNSVSACPSGGYGIFVFVPYNQVTVSDNTVSGCSVGLASFGSASDTTPYTPPTIAFSGNKVDGQNGTDSTGVLVTTDEIGFGCADTAATFTSNVVENTTNSFYSAVGDIFGLGDPSCGTITMSAHFNRVVDNTAPFSSGGSNGWLNTAGTTVDAVNNWWGCNAGPNHSGCETVAAGVTNSPYLKMQITTSQPAITNNTKGLLVSFRINSNGQDTSGSGNIPDGTPVAFLITSGGGSLGPCDTSTMDGEANCTFNAPGSPDMTGVSATTDNQTVSTTVETDLPPTMTTVTSSSTNNTSTYGQSVIFTATVTSAYGSPTTGTVHFYDGAVSPADLIGSNALNAGSQASVSTAALTALGSPHTINAVYDGNSSWAPSSGSLSQVVHRAHLIITASSPTGTYGHSSPTVLPIYAGFRNGDTPSSLSSLPTCSSSAPAQPDRGQYITSCVNAAGGNYNITYTTGILTINPSPLKIRAKNYVMHTGGPVPTVMPKYTGLKYGHTAPLHPPVCGTDATASSPPGHYKTFCHNAHDLNYVMHYKNGTMTVLS